MALPDYSFLEAGTPVTWKSSGGDKAITLTSLANDAAREGAKSATLLDGAKGMPELLEIRLESAVGSAATDGKEIELWIGESDDADAADANPGNLTGADAALSNPDELKRQLYHAVSLSLSNARGTNIQKQRGLYYPTCLYIIPVVVNKSGQTLSGTAGDHQIVVTPYYRKTAD